jgi:hypothetical protein
MIESPPGAAPKELGELVPALAYTIATMVTDKDEYRRMVAALREAGFGDDDCEYIFADNSRGNRYDAFEAYNRFLLEARGRYVILCHQDILPLTDGRRQLDERLGELTRLDPSWGLCGNAGVSERGRLAVRITDPHQANRNEGGPFPVKVMSLDENFIVVRREANLALSRDLSGFHWYGADLSILAEIIGYGAYVIDFHLLHKSAGRPDDTFFAGRERLKRKYWRAFRSRILVSPVNRVFLSGSQFRHFADKLWHGIGRRCAPFLAKLTRSSSA